MQTQVLVIKCGGSILYESKEFINSIINNMQQLQNLGYKLILVHGGGPEINELCVKLKLDTSFKKGLRVTTQAILEAVQLALLGKINPALVTLLNQNGVNALGLSGHDTGLLQAEAIDSNVLGFIGQIKQVKHKLLNTLLALNIIPVIAPLAIDSNFQTLNVNADIAAAAIAVAAKASKLILISNIDGYYGNYPNESSLVQQLTNTEVIKLLQNKNSNLSAGMIPKLEACLNAVNGGVLAQIINGNKANNLINAVLDTQQIGTTIIKE